ncbi:acyl carrier protein [Bradyrhizobium sp. SZCCHNRI2049]|uniref:acyl carrier protein n=1 Tax=Bradyrhizobium sp. SZCCHNRI2049 TaxID=3057287 RepID=UPI002916F3D6|nr:acyl carrier protein [Bradyrhizobium sp. SZCCHNRI2049]
MDRNKLYEVVIDCIREVVPELQRSTLVGNESFESLGINSVERADVIARSLEALSLNVARVSVSGAKTIEEFVDLLHEKFESP